MTVYTVFDGNAPIAVIAMSAPPRVLALTPEGSEVAEWAEDGCPSLEGQQDERGIYEMPVTVPPSDSLWGLAVLEATEERGWDMREAGELKARILGGPGSGFHGHAGRPGQVGGSLPSLSRSEAEAATMCYLKRRPEHNLREGYNKEAKAAGRPELSEAEYHVLRGFVDVDYLRLNLPLRAAGFERWQNGVIVALKPFGPDKTTSNFAGAVQTMNAALDKMPTHVGEVHRWAHLGPEDSKVLESYQPGKVITEPGFMSASIDALPAEKFGGLFWTPPNVRYVIKSKNAREVSFTYLVAYPQEREVIFKSGSRFRVTQRRRSGNIHIIEMTEVG